MLSRHDISDDHWNRIKNLLPGQAGGHGGVGNDSRLFISSIRYLAKTGIAWADLPACYGKPNSLWQRFNHWCQRGVWQKIADALRDDDTEWLSIDSEPIEYDRHLYKEHNVVERCFALIKQYRRVATRYEKRAANFLEFVWVASIAIMLV